MKKKRRIWSVVGKHKTGKWIESKDYKTFDKILPVLPDFTQNWKKVEQPDIESIGLPTDPTTDKTY